MPQDTFLPRIRAFFRSLVCPRSVGTNRNTGLLRIPAIAAMVVDHFGKMLFPQLTWMRMIGRLAFPVFAYGIAVGAVCTRHPEKYLNRLIAMTLLCQPVYAMALGHQSDAMFTVPFFPNPLACLWNFYRNCWDQPSILMTLTLGLSILLALRSGKYLLTAGLLMLCTVFSSKIDYGVQGVLFILLCYLFLEHPALFTVIVPAYFLLWAASGHGYNFFGHSFGMRICGLPAVLACCIPLRKNLRLPPAFSYAFYPAHLLVLCAFVWLPQLL